MRVSTILLALTAGLLGPAVASAQIFQPGTQPAGEEGGLETQFRDSFNCTACHANYDGADDFEPWDSWRGAMMSHAGRDPIFRAALAIAEEDNPDAADFCIRCHSPVAWLRGRSSLPEWSEADGPRLDPDDEFGLTDDNDGVACAVCHRAAGETPAGQPEPAIANAQIYFADGEDAVNLLGPYSYSPENEPSHPWRQTTFLAQGEFCGQCHDIYNPVVMGRRADGTETGRPFAIERTFSEWQSSAFATRGETCQDCHMPESETPLPAADGEAPQDYFRRHDLAGGNYWMPRALARTIDDVDGNVAPALEASADRAIEMLQSAATVEITEASLADGTVSATVRVTNRTGHKLPTGYPEGRRMWLEVAIVDDTGSIVAGSGLFEDGTVVPDAQLRTYEIKLGVGATESFHFILNDTVLTDTRIPPEGFTPPADRDMDPVGRDYTNDDGSYRHYDEASFAFPACGRGMLSVRATLRFQTTTREYIEFLRDNAPPSLDPAIAGDDGTGSWGRIAYDLWQMHGGDAPVDMASAERVAGENECPAIDAGVDGGRVDGGTGTPPDDDGCDCSTADPSSLAPLFALFACWIRSRRRR
jgi:uncharacterized protein (TIGR03382 family)